MKNKIIGQPEIFYRMLKLKKKKFRKGHKIKI
jgi:hypothetical protein